MELLDTYWGEPGFRKAVGTLVSLSPAQLRTLRRLTDEAFELPDDAAIQFGVDPGQFKLSLIILSALYFAARDEGEPAILDHIGRLAATRGDEEARAIAKSLELSRQELVALLGIRPPIERQRKRQSVQRSGMAALKDADLFVDLRIAEDGTDWKMVPVVLARLNFDEPVQLGASSVTFQIPETVLAKLRTQLEAAEKAADDARKRLGDQML